MTLRPSMLRLRPGTPQIDFKFGKTAITQTQSQSPPPTPTAYSSQKPQSSRPKFHGVRLHYTTLTIRYVPTITYDECTKI